MKKTITLNTFRKVERMEEAMMRASMPRTSAADPVVPQAPAPRRTVPARTWSFGRVRAAQGFALAEVVHG